jgi:peptidoglycan/LPS O-acetylase OafA/YrhL
MEQYAGGAMSGRGRPMIPCEGEAVNHGGRHLPYQPALDGIRALAVAAVLAYHGGLSWARGGFLGVDAFFVLSGYLITSLLLLEWRARGRIGLLAFWARRARRLLPALFLMLIGVGVYAVAFASPLELDKIRGDALATIGYVANWRQVFRGQSYFDQFSVPSPLRHTWSLAIEEQYYAIWPLLLLVLLRLARVSLRKLLAISLVMIAASALLMGLLFQPGHDPSRVYYGTDTRAHSLLVGAALAMLLLQSGPLRSRLAGHGLQVAAIVCAVGLGWVWVVASGDSAFLYRGGFLLLALAVAVVIAASVQPKAGPIGRVLSLPPLRALGLISYGVYLWHWPVYLVLTPGRTGWDGYGLFAVRVLATLAIAVASYRLIEMPVRRGAFRQWKVSWTLAPAAAVSLAVVLVFATRGAVSPTGASPAAAMPQISTVAESGPIRAILLGDSVALSVRPGLEQLAPEWNLSVWNRANLGCGFLEVDKEVDPRGNLSKEQADRCREWREEWPSDLDSFRPDVVIMLFGGQDSYDRLVNGVMLEAGTPEWKAYVMSGLEKQLDLFSSKGAKMLLATFPCSRPAAWDSVPDAAEREEETFRRINELNEVYRQFAEEHPDKVILADLNVFACPESRFTDLVIDGVRMREDGTHFTEGGSPIVARWLAPQIVAAASLGREGTVSAPTRVMLLGDSVATSLAVGLVREGPPAGLAIWNKGGLGCGFLPADEEVDAYGKWSATKAETCQKWRSEWSSDVDTFQPDVVVFLFGPWDTLSLKVDGRLLEVGTPEWKAYALEELGHTVDVLSARGAKVMLLTSPCFKPRDLDVDGTAYIRLNPQAVDELNDLYREFARQHPDQVVIVDLNSYVCPEGDYTDVTIDGVHLREDGVHFTAEGADVAARWLAPQIIAAVPEGRWPAPAVGASAGMCSDGDSQQCSPDLGSAPPLAPAP